jgi:hypothetical protein
MKVEKFLCMAGGAGDSSYAANSKLQVWEIPIFLNLVGIIHSSAAEKDISSRINNGSAFFIVYIYDIN